MLKIHTWDELSGKWTQLELNLPPDTRTPDLINDTLAKTFGEDLPAWAVAAAGKVGNILTIECRSDRGHQSIILVNDQEN